MHQHCKYIYVCVYLFFLLVSKPQLPFSHLKHAVMAYNLNVCWCQFKTVGLILVIVMRGLIIRLISGPRRNTRSRRDDVRYPLLIIFACCSITRPCTAINCTRWSVVRFSGTRNTLNKVLNYCHNRLITISFFSFSSVYTTAIKIFNHISCQISPIRSGLRLFHYIALRPIFPSLPWTRPQGRRFLLHAWPEPTGVAFSLIFFPILSDTITSVVFSVHIPYTYKRHALVVVSAEYNTAGRDNTQLYFCRCCDRRVLKCTEYCTKYIGTKDIYCLFCRGSDIDAVRLTAGRRQSFRNRIAPT